ncbi:hypothetical protein SEA_CHEESETOUCH_78 [Gordonia phage CheeseTouch]
MSDKVSSCKHCDKAIETTSGVAWLHTEGPQRGKIRCAIDPYGYNAAPADEPCDFTCNGYLGGGSDE